MKEGREIPSKFANAPELRLGLELYYAAFMDLAASRPMGLGEGTIPWHVITEYARTYEFSEDQREDLHFYIGRMDEAYLKHVSNKTKSGTKSQPKKGIGK